MPEGQPGSSGLLFLRRHRSDSICFPENIILFVKRTYIWLFSRNTDFLRQNRHDSSKSQLKFFKCGCLVFVFCFCFCGQRRQTTPRGCWTTTLPSTWSSGRGSAFLKRSTTMTSTTTFPLLTCRSTAGNVSGSTFLHGVLTWRL